MKRTSQKATGRKSIFRSLFAPLFLILIFQAIVFYFAAVYGGVEESLSQNAADVLSERLTGRAYELETKLNNKWTDFDACSTALGELYAGYEAEFGAYPLAGDSTRQIAFLRDAAPQLINTLRRNGVNGVFFIINDEMSQTSFPSDGAEERYGLCIRDMDQDSAYSGTEDLQLERAPSSIIDALGCSLDSWWEAKYRFPSRAAGDYYYEPLDAAWAHPHADGDDLLYCAATHQISGSDPAVVSCSIPLSTADGYPYGVLGVELSVKYLASLLPSRELNGPDKSCYVLAMQEAGSVDCTPLLGSGVLYSRCFANDAAISLANENATGGFDVTGRGNVALYGKSTTLNMYNNNSPFEGRRLVLLAFVERATLFAYIERIKLTLMAVSAFSLLLGIMGILFISRRFAAPITALSKRVRGMNTQPDFSLDRLGITEIDQLVDAIEELNRNVGKGSARTEFFSRMSHDMRTPMNAIISFSSPELLEGASEATKDDYLDKIHASGEYLLALINEVLDMTKIESNKTELRTASVQASRLFDTTVPIIEKLAEKKRLHFVSEIGIPADVYVEADVQHINQIVMNLLSNAVKFTPEDGSVILSAALVKAFTDETRVGCRITVTDTGIGMSEAFMQNLYTPFEQESNRHEGTGLGLSIAHKLVGLMGGTIDCTSQRNHGTTFVVTLPLQRAAGQPSQNALHAPGVDGSHALTGARILVCEDNAINLLIVQRLLEKWGVAVEHAENGEIGLERFAAAPEGHYSAILMDVQMPVMDGLLATKAIRALNRPDAARIPIIAMTANAFAEDAAASSAAGMNAHLAKPVEPALLLSTLTRLLFSTAN